MRGGASPQEITEQMRLFGSNMRAARNLRGIAQDHPQLERAKLDKGMVSYLELGERSPRLATILRIACVLHVTPQGLLAGIGTDGAQTTELPPPRHDLDRPQARLGANLRWARKRTGASQMSLASEAEVDRANLGAIERGERNPQLDTMLKLAWTLELPPALLLHGVQVDAANQEPLGAAGAPTDHAIQELRDGADPI